MSSSSVITTVNERVLLQCIWNAVTLESCKGDVAERELKISKLMAVQDEEILDFLLINYALPYKDYIETGIKPSQYTKKPTNNNNNTISFEQFWHKFCNLMDYKNSKDSQEGIIRYLWTEAFTIPNNTNNNDDWKESVSMIGTPRESFRNV